MPAPPPESEPAMRRILAVGVTLLAFDLLPGAKLSMCTGWRIARQSRINGSRGGPNGLANLVDHLLDERGVVTFGHHPDERLGSRLADQQAPSPFQLAFGIGNALLDGLVVEGRAAVEAD